MSKKTEFAVESHVGHQWNLSMQSHLWATIASSTRISTSNLKHSCCSCCCQVSSVVSDSVRPHRQKPTRLRHPWDSTGKNTGAGCHFLFQCMNVKSESEVTQSCLTLRNPMDCSLPGSSIHGIFQARVLEWVASAFSENIATLHHTQGRWKNIQNTVEI